MFLLAKCEIFLSLTLPNPYIQCLFVTVLKYERSWFQTQTMETIFQAPFIWIKAWNKNCQKLYPGKREGGLCGIVRL
jgi:hypothetical protein